MFLEVNARIQVEHPVTEMLTGLDLVELQLSRRRGRTATDLAGRCQRSQAMRSRLGFTPKIRRAVTCRRLADCGGSSRSTHRARHDSGPTSGDVVTAHYDPMLAKTIVHAEDRAGKHWRVRRRRWMRGRSTELTTNLAQLSAVLASDDFGSRVGGHRLAGSRRTARSSSAPADALGAAALAEVSDRRMAIVGRVGPQVSAVMVKPHEVRLRRSSDGWWASVDDGEAADTGSNRGRDWSAEVSGKRRRGQSTQSQRWVFLRERRIRTGAGRSRASGANVVRAPMPGTMIQVLVASG